jgi:hypothetical protein
MAKTICKILGVVFLLVGALGFAAPNLMGMHLSGVHNIIHLVSGVLALYFGFAATPAAARTFSLVFGAIYLLLGLLGFVAPDLVANILQARETPGPTGSLVPDNIVHLLLGAVFLIGALMRAPTGTPITPGRGTAVRP